MEWLARGARNFQRAPGAGIPGRMSRTLCSRRWSATRTALRSLFYLADEFKQAIAGEYRKIFCEKALRLPGPECYVVYTGVKESPDEMQLSDAFLEDTGALSLRVRVISEEGDSIIGQYIGFSKYVRNGRDGPGGLARAVREAVGIYDKSKAFTRFLKSRRDVVDMFMEELTFEDVLEARGEEYLERGREEGREGERVSAIRRMLGIGLTHAQIMDMEYTADEIERAMADNE